MSPLRLRRAIQRSRCRTAVVAVVLVVAAAVAAHHTTPMPAGMHMTPAAVCVAVLGVAVLAAAVVTGSVWRLPRRTFAFSALVLLIPAAAVAAAARAGPVRLQVLRL